MLRLLLLVVTYRRDKAGAGTPSLWGLMGMQVVVEDPCKTELHIGCLLGVLPSGRELQQPQPRLL
jgi:hypothetical protein